MNKETIKRLMLKLRQESGLTLDQIAEQSEVNRKTLDTWIYEGRVPTAEKFIQYVQACGYEFKIVKKVEEQEKLPVIGE